METLIAEFKSKTNFREIETIEEIKDNLLFFCLIVLILHLPKNMLVQD